MRDEIYRSNRAHIADFEFDQAVTEVFDDMLGRSIPFYNEIQKMILDWVQDYYVPGTHIYDLGCSTGSILVTLAEGLPSRASLIGIDNSPPMIAEAEKRLKPFRDQHDITLQLEDLRNVPWSQASVVIMNYTLQFVRPLYRRHVVSQIFDALQPGGLFLFSEKVLEDSTHLSRLFMARYYQFKRRQGYSDLEISRKREALENVLVPYKVGEHKELLRECGFTEVDVYFKWHNFASFLALKPLQS